MDDMVAMVLVEQVECVGWLLWFDLLAYPDRATDERTRAEFDFEQSNVAPSIWIGHTYH
jgi:hypothetical protein